MGASLQLIAEPHDFEQIVSLKEEINALRQEVHQLRRRDEVVHFYLHRLDEELRLAARLQQDFLPRELPSVGAVRFHALFRPASYVSGDLYDVFRLDETRVGFYLADAIGHGVPSALLTMFLRTSLVSKEIFPGGYRILPPGETLARLNVALTSQNFSQTTFATAVYGVIDSATGEVSLSRAGHPLPVLLSADGSPPRALDCGGGPLLGVFAADQTFGTQTIHMRPGDRLLLHSDGIDTLQDEQDLQEPTVWLDRLMNANGCTTTPAAFAQLTEHLDRRDGSLAPKDDVTIISVQIES